MVDIIQYIRDHPNKKWHTIQEMREHFKVGRNNITRKAKILNRFGILDIQVDGKKFLIARRIKKNGRKS